MTLKRLYNPEEISVGMSVKLTALPKHIACPEYPIVGTMHECAGTIIELKSTLPNCVVAWDNGQRGTYFMTTLSVIQADYKDIWEEL